MTDEIKPDIRRVLRQIKLKPRTIGGQEIINAVKQVAREIGTDYEQRVISNNFGGDIYVVGIGSIHPYKAVVIRHGEWLENLGFREDKPYSKIGVGSTDWPGAEYFSIYEDILEGQDVNRLVTEAVEEVQKRLEEKLM